MQNNIMGEGVDGRLEKKIMMCREKRKNKGERGKEKREQGVKNGVKCNIMPFFGLKRNSGLISQELWI